MSTVAPRWALNAQAIDALGDPLLQPGVHLRIVPSPLLGLPAAPFQVSRIALGENASQATLRRDIIWRAPDGATVTPPFDPDTYGGTVIGYLPAPASGICCWIEVDATPRPGSVGCLLGIGGGVGSALGRLIGIVAGPRLPSAWALAVEAGVATERGNAVLVRRSQPRYQLAASRIEFVVVRGQGEVRGVAWVDARAVAGSGVWRTLALPHPGGARYLGIQNAAGEAATRVQRGAPLRQGLHDAPASASAGLTPAATAADETTRLSVLTPDVLAWVGKLLTDTSKSQQEQTQAATLKDAAGQTIGTFEFPTLAAVLQTSLDPGMGRWLGLVDRDEAPPGGTTGDVVAYLIRGIWQVDTAALGALGDTLAADAILPDVADVHGQPTIKTTCDEFAGLVKGTQLGIEIARSGVTYRSLGTASLTATDVLPPTGRCEIAFNPAGLRITLPTPADRALVEVAQFNGASFAVRAFNAASGLLQQLVRSPAAGVVDPVSLMAVGIIRIEIVSFGPPGVVTTGGGTTRGGTAGGGGTIGSGGTGTVVVGPGGGGTGTVVVIPGGGPPTPPVTTPPAAQPLVLARLCYTVTTQPPPGPSGPFLDLSVVACASIGYPPDHPLPPAMDDPVVGPWAPITPPQAKREITLPLRGLTAGGALALARQVAGTILGLNQRSSVGRALPLVASVPSTAVEPGSGEVTDHKAPAPALVYRSAQADWFGRWSDWATRAAPAGVRPMPPRPILFATYLPPTIATPMPTTPLAGTIDVRIPVPATDGMAPASNLLASIEIRLTVAGTTSTTTTLLPATGTLPAELAVGIPGPAIPRTERREVQLSGTWIDSARARSLDSLPLNMILVDPRPPVQVVLPGTLQYAARPDVTGWSRAELSWTAVGGQQRFRVFVTDETSVQMRLEKMVKEIDAVATRAQTLLSAIDPAAPAPIPGPVARAAIYTANADILGRDMFEQLTDSPIESPSTGEIRFAHALSGSLRLLSFYRVVAISGSNVEADFSGAPLVPIAVPNTGPPPAPLINVLPLIGKANALPPVPQYRVQVQLTILRGLVPAAEFRLRRSRMSAADPSAMPIVASGPVPAAVGDAQQKLDVIDVGTSQISPAGTLRPWVDYVWRAEVRGAPEPGGGPAAEWSSSSASAGVMLVPPEPPAMATDLTVTRVAGGPAAVQWKHPDVLIGGRLGSYRCELYRRIGTSAEDRLASIDAEAPATSGGRDANGWFTYEEPTTPVPPDAASYRVIIIDPMGRASAPTPPVRG